jgi:hypothetical protein
MLAAIARDRACRLSRRWNADPESAADAGAAAAGNARTSEKRQGTVARPLPKREETPQVAKQL